MRVSKAVQFVLSFRFVSSIFFISAGVLLFQGLPKLNYNAKELIEVRPGEIIDLGTLSPGNPHHATFSLEAATNDSTILLAAVRTECRCTVVQIPEDRVVRSDAPCLVEVCWTPSEDVGVQRKNILIQYIVEDTLHTKILTLFGEVLSS